MMNENLRMTTPERKKFLFQGKGGRNRKNFFLVLERLEAGKETVRKNCYSRTRKTDRRTNGAQWFRTAKNRDVITRPLVPLAHSLIPVLVGKNMIQ